MCSTEIATSGRASAARRIISRQWPSSVCSLFRNLRRAGVLKYSSRTSIVVPRVPAAGDSAPVCASIRIACEACSVRLVMYISDTDAIDASASPRNPSVATASSSASERILLVAWRISASASSPSGMPQPSSVIEMRLTPPSSSRMRSVFAPASSAFSSTSLTTDAGRSTTSPAAIWLISWSGSGWIARNARGVTALSTAFAAGLEAGSEAWSNAGPGAGLVAGLLPSGVSEDSGIADMAKL
ncbi:conserved hypothetical protein [Paraburkholderia piptadeniae]|uniref:Uncharacterized protein n=1 Tax=Paraburkholderia piptadeniae TaxID=1701573 RepID=A0A1N7RLX7_9BURK|nr:conserved hypothetical protein [Paraburkholderia piptadeniae]